MKSKHDEILKKKLRNVFFSWRQSYSLDCCEQVERSKIKYKKLHGLFEWFYRKISECGHISYSSIDVLYPWSSSWHRRGACHNNNAIIYQKCRRRGGGPWSHAPPWARATKNVKKPQNQTSHVEKLKLRFLHNKKIRLLGSVTHLILETAIVQNKCWV